MKVELLDRHGRGYSIGGRQPGRVMDVAGNVAQIWIERGFARAVAEDRPQRLVPQDRARKMRAK